MHLEHADGTDHYIRMLLRKLCWSYLKVSELYISICRVSNTGFAVHFQVTPHGYPCKNKVIQKRGLLGARMADWPWQEGDGHLGIP